VVDTVAMILSAIADVAPELEPELADLDHDVDFWTELQLDSMDHLAVMTRLSEQTGIDIAERDYPHLTTINALRDFLRAAE
jgi:acyl carrier protein